jgi:hypothetical protein
LRGVGRTLLTAAHTGRTAAKAFTTCGRRRVC